MEVHTEMLWSTAPSLVMSQLTDSINYQIEENPSKRLNHLPIKPPQASTSAYLRTQTLQSRDRPFQIPGRQIHAHNQMVVLSH